MGLAGSRDVPAPTSDTMFILVAKNAGGETRSEMLIQVTGATRPGDHWR